MTGQISMSQDFPELLWAGDNLKKEIDETVV
jgi:hypothetical protein